MADNLQLLVTLFHLTSWFCFFSLSLFVSKQHRNEAAWDFANSEDAGVWLG